jgi:TetR/AcrR family transcriptional repressor of nem operon
MATLTTREHLIDVGLQLIHSTGYTASGVKQILDLANVPKGSFYHYFPSKEAFTQEVLSRYGTIETDRLEGFLSNRKLPPLKRLRKYFEALAAFYEQKNLTSGCLLGNLSLEIADHSPALQPVLSTAFDRWQQAIATTLREAVDRGDLPKSTKSDDLAAFLLSGWEGALVRMRADKSNKPLDNFIHFAFNVLLKN